MLLKNSQCTEQPPQQKGVSPVPGSKVINAEVESLFYALLRKREVNYVTPKCKTSHLKQSPVDTSIFTSTCLDVPVFCSEMSQLHNST